LQELCYQALCYQALGRPPRWLPSRGARQAAPPTCPAGHEPASYHPAFHGSTVWRNTVSRPTPPHGPARRSSATRRAQEAVQVALDRRDNGGDAAEQRFASAPAGNDHYSPTRATA